MNNRIMVIGGAGYVGSAIVEQLLADGATVLVFDNFSVGSEYRLPIDNPNLSMHAGSITNLPALQNVMTQFEPNLVFHLAAIHYIPVCIANPQAVIDTNITGTANVVAAIKKLNPAPRLIFASSASVYGAETPAPQTIDCGVRPCDIYGYSKLLGEHLVVSQLENYTIARLFNVFGESDPTPHLIPSIVRQLDQPLVELGSSTAKRDYVFVQDAARAFIALSKRGKVGGTYNIGTGSSYTVEEVCDLLCSILVNPPVFKFNAIQPRPVDPPALCADIADLVRDTGWKPSVGLRAGLSTVLPPRTTLISATKGEYIVS